MNLFFLVLVMFTETGEQQIINETYYSSQQECLNVAAQMAPSIEAGYSFCHKETF